MDVTSWDAEFGDARKRLAGCSDSLSLRQRGHELKDGVVLMSVSGAPFEMSVKCVRCGGARWRLNEQSRERLADECRPRTVVSSHA